MTDANYSFCSFTLRVELGIHIEGTVFSTHETHNRITVSTFRWKNDDSALIIFFCH